MPSFAENQQLSTEPGVVRQKVLEKMRTTIREHLLFDPDGAVLLMVSGGSDSTALARLAARLRDSGELGVVDMMHMNHKLRGPDADADAAFVAALADELDIPLFQCEMDIAAEAQRLGDNVEAVARRERYLAANEALVSMCQHEGVPVADGRIVTAHTVDDRIENFYMRSIVGTGPGGFRSMRYRNGLVVRPLLDCTRQELREYLEEDGGACVLGSLWREDATNAHTDRFRAYVRHEIVPKAREWSEGVYETLPRTMNLIAEEDDMLDQMAEDIIRQDVEMLGEDGADGFLLLPSFGAHPVPLARRVVHRLLKPMLGPDARVDSATVVAVLNCFENGVPRSGHVANIQGDIAASSNKRGVTVEPMAAYRARRKKR